MVQRNTSEDRGSKKHLKDPKRHNKNLTLNDTGVSMNTKVDKENNSHENISSQDSKKNESEDNNYAIDLEILYSLGDNIKEIRLFGKKFYERIKDEKDLFKLMINGDIKTTISEFIEIKNKTKILNVQLKIKKDMNDLSYMFAGCKEIIYIKANSLIRAGVKNVSNMFLNCSSLKTILNLNDFETSSVTDMSSIFRGCTALKNLNGICNFNTRNVENMSCMFYNCENLQSIQLNKWHTNNNQFFSGTFYGCKLLKSLRSISRFNLDKSKDLSLFFYNCESLEELPDISDWNTHKVKRMKGMFYGCKKIQNIPDISKWNTQNLIDISCMFYGCKSLISLPNIFSKWEMKNIIDISNIFYDCKNLDFSNFNFGECELLNAENISGMFYGCEKLIEIKNFFKIGNNIKDVSFLFYECANLKKLPENFDFKADKLEKIKGMYYNCKSLEKIPDIPYWNLQNVKNMSYMGCEKNREIPMQFNGEEIIGDKNVNYMNYKYNNDSEEKEQFFRVVDKKRIN